DSCDEAVGSHGLDRLEGVLTEGRGRGASDVGGGGAGYEGGRGARQADQEFPELGGRRCPMCLPDPPLELIHSQPIVGKRLAESVVHLLAFGLRGRRRTLRFVIHRLLPPWRRPIRVTGSPSGTPRTGDTNLARAFITRDSLRKHRKSDP